MYEETERDMYDKLSAKWAEEAERSEKQRENDAKTHVVTLTFGIILAVIWTLFFW